MDEQEARTRLEAAGWLAVGYRCTCAERRWGDRWERREFSAPTFDEARRLLVASVETEARLRDVIARATIETQRLVGAAVMPFGAMAEKILEILQEVKP
jgi:hypothetical protein